MCQRERKQSPSDLHLQNQNLAHPVNSGCICSADRGGLSIHHLVLCVFSVCLCVTEQVKHSWYSSAYCYNNDPYLFVSAFYIEQTENPCFFPSSPGQSNTFIMLQVRCVPVGKKCVCVNNLNNFKMYIFLSRIVQTFECLFHHVCN